MAATVITLHNEIEPLGTKYVNNSGGMYQVRQITI